MLFLTVLLLLAVAVTTCGRRHHLRKGTGLLIGESEDDIRDNVFNYDEQGGGEEDEASPTAAVFRFKPPTGLGLQMLRDSRAFHVLVFVSPTERLQHRPAVESPRGPLQPRLLLPNARFPTRQAAAQEGRPP